MARLDQSPKTVSIVDLSLDGRGVARWPEGHANAGKAVFVSGALPGETVSVQQTARSRHFDEAKTLEVIEASPDRVEPRCPHFGTCGGCVLLDLHLPGLTGLEVQVRLRDAGLQLPVVFISASSSARISARAASSTARRAGLTMSSSSAG